MKGGIDVEYCMHCGTRLEQIQGNHYICNNCDTLYTICVDTITYLNNASIVLEQLANDLKLMNKKIF